MNPTDQTNRQIKIDDLTPKQVNDLTATRILEWHKQSHNDEDLPFPEYYCWVDKENIPAGFYHDDWNPCSDIAQAWMLAGKFWNDADRLNWARFVNRLGRSTAALLCKATSEAAEIISRAALWAVCGETIEL